MAIFVSCGNKILFTKKNCLLTFHHFEVKLWFCGFAKLLCEIIRLSAIPKWQSNISKLRNVNVTVRKEISIQDWLLSEEYEQGKNISVSWIHLSDFDGVTSVAPRTTETNSFADDSHLELYNFADIRSYVARSVQRKPYIYTNTRATNKRSQQFYLLSRFPCSQVNTIPSFLQRMSLNDGSLLSSAVSG